jgi:hypothetical protein
MSNEGVSPQISKAIDICGITFKGSYRGGRQLTGDYLENKQNQTRPQKCKQTFSKKNRPFIFFNFKNCFKMKS